MIIATWGYSDSMEGYLPVSMEDDWIDEKVSDILKHVRKSKNFRWWASGDTWVCSGPSAFEDCIDFHVGD